MKKLSIKKLGLITMAIATSALVVVPQTHASEKVDPGFSVVDKTKKASKPKVDPGFSVVDKTKKASKPKVDPGFSVVDK
ncbi:hypothetical protein DOS74_04840, partial [Staphylococcus felis]